MASENLVSALSAGMGGALSSILLHPLDAIKTQIQSDTGKKGQASATRSTTEVCRDIVRKGGLGALYVGVWIKAFESASTKALYFYIFNFLGGGTFSSAAGELVAGYAAEILNKPLTLPLEVVAYRMICSKRPVTPTEAFRDLVDEHGIMGVYSGFTASLFAAIKPAIHFGIFEQIKKTVLQGARKELGFVEVCHSSKVFARIAFCTPPRSNVRTCGRVPEQALCDAVSHFVGFCSAD
eukprot:m.1055015 g.1055015  ORF g.1055015 m.1055015 type:complete len:238 (+) comp24192_c1_seq9:266-979(+)